MSNFKIIVLNILGSRTSALIILLTDEVKNVAFAEYWILSIDSKTIIYKGWNILRMNDNDAARTKLKATCEPIRILVPVFIDSAACTIMSVAAYFFICLRMSLCKMVVVSLYVGF